MTPASFEQSTHCLGRPTGMTADECDPLSVANVETHDGKPIVISCWKLTKDELEEFQKTGRIWLFVWGHTMPPVSLSANTPFGT